MSIDNATVNDEYRSVFIELASFSIVRTYGILRAHCAADKTIDRWTKAFQRCEDDYIVAGVS